MTVYELGDRYHESLGELFVSEEAAIDHIHELIANMTGEWSEERHANGDLTIQFKELTPVRRLYRYLHEWYISPIEVHG